MFFMPGQSFSGPLPQLTKEQATLGREMKHDLKILADSIGERNVLGQPSSLAAAADFLGEELTKVGYAVNRQSYPIDEKTCENLEVEITGSDLAKEIVVVGAHYDSVIGSPGANDNGSGTVATLALARRFAGKPRSRTLRFVLFVNEEPPFFQTHRMGSLVYAEGCEEHAENIVAMLSLETIGYYSDRVGSQSYPFPFNLLYPPTGNFICFVGNFASRKLVKKVVGSFRSDCEFPSEGAAVPSFVPGVGWSDHWSFWQMGYPGLMVTDTAPFRYPFYHTPEDTLDKIDFDRTARVVDGIRKVVEELSGVAPNCAGTEEYPASSERSSPERLQSQEGETTPSRGDTKP